MGKENDNVSEVLGFFTKYWHFLTIIFGLIVSLTYHVVELQTAHKTINELVETNAKLVDQFKELDVKVKEVYDFTPPRATQKRINDLEFRAFGRTQDYIMMKEGSASYNPQK